MSWSRTVLSKSNRVGRVVLSLVMLLCLCIVLQMLGVPTTLLSPVDAADALGASVLEGFSVLPALPQPELQIEICSVTDVHSSMHVPVLAFVHFHPPVL
ncbi:hypothetical protein [Petrachloros mirabilis]|jgi:hypothetical protein